MFVSPARRRGQSAALCTLLPVLCISFTILTVAVHKSQGQNRHQQQGLYRSYSDPRLNRNHTYSEYNNQGRRTSFSNRHDSCKTNYKFDYVLLSLQWAPGMCSTSPRECKRNAVNHFTVHGMWPTISGTEEPSNCCFDNTFDYKSLEPLLPVLNEYWFSYYDSGDSRRFWSHEWLKHGTCSRDIADLRGEKRYFGTTVQMAKQMPILETLKAANIVPDDQRSYKSSDIAKALAPIAQGKVFQIDCDYEHHQPIPIMTGLNFCFDSNLKPANCPEMKRRCQRQVIIPASIKRFKR